MVRLLVSELGRFFYRCNVHSKIYVVHSLTNVLFINPLTPNGPYRCRTAPLTTKRCILYIYSANIATEYFKRGIYSPVFPLQNEICFIILT